MVMRDWLMKNINICNMKKIFYFIFLLSVMSCNDDETINDRNYDPMDLYGEWLFYDGTNKFSAVHMIIDNNAKLKLDVYANYETSGEPWRTAVGSWFYSSRTKHMKTTSLYEAQEVSIDKSYDIMNVDNCTLKMLDTDTHSFVTYHRVINTYNKFMSETFRIENYPDGFSPSEYISLNEKIVTVSADGLIMTKTPGQTFVVAKDGERKVAVKIIVETNVKEHAAEVNQDNLNIWLKYGIPDSKNMKGFDNGITAYWYFNPESEPFLKQLKFNIDQKTNTVTCIEAIYNSNVALENDCNYIKYIYNYCIVNNSKRYVEKSFSTFGESLYFVQIYNNGIAFVSTQYFLTHGYYNGTGNQ